MTWLNIVFFWQNEVQVQVTTYYKNEGREKLLHSVALEDISIKTLSFYCSVVTRFIVSQLHYVLNLILMRVRSRVI